VCNEKGFFVAASIHFMVYKTNNFLSLSAFWNCLPFCGESSLTPPNSFLFRISPIGAVLMSYFCMSMPLLYPTFFSFLSSPLLSIKKTECSCLKAVTEAQKL